MSDTTPPVPLTLASRADQVFPTLTPEQIARVAAHGRVRRVERGEVLLEPGDQNPRVFIAGVSSPAKSACSRVVAGSSACARARPAKSSSSIANSY